MSIQCARTIPVTPHIPGQNTPKPPQIPQPWRSRLQKCAWQTRAAHHDVYRDAIDVRRNFRDLRQAVPPDRVVLYLVRALPILNSGALSNLDKVAVRIADVAAPLAVLLQRLRHELGPPTLP